MLAAGGEEALQMKELAQRAGVSLATVYRYFPSKDHVLLAISISRYEDALRRVSAEPPRGDTLQERITSHLLREFRAVQRDQVLTGALSKVLTERPEYSQVLARIDQLHMQMLEHVATAGGPVSAELRQRLRIVFDIAAEASRRWFAGVSSAAEARFAIRTGCYLLSTLDSRPAHALASLSKPSQASGETRTP
jgi:AcrR family transcriptional regulator